MTTQCFPACALTLIFGAAACVRPAFAPSGMNISSDRSDYAPTARLAVALGPLSISGNAIEIVIDSGSLAVPGDAASASGGDMFNVHLTALVVTAVERHENEALPNPWRVVAQSDSELVLASIHRGERRGIGPLRLVVPRPRDVAPKNTWVVFRLTGNVIPHEAKVVGQASSGLPRMRRFRVYACADWNLNARVDRRRAKVMNASYLKAC